MQPADTLVTSERPATIRSAEDAIIILHQIPWETFEALVEAKGDSGNPRYAYLDGELEIMSPSVGHELVKKTLARLIEAYGLLCDVPICGIGSTTLKTKLRKKGIEPDECYFVRRAGGDDDNPDLAIEVAWSRGGLDKKPIYAALGVRELWIWRRRGGLTVHRLEGSTYRIAPESELLPGLDLQRLATLAARADQHAAVQEWARALRSPGT